MRFLTPGVLTRFARGSIRVQFQYPSLAYSISYSLTHSPYDNHPPRLVESYRRASFDDIPREPVHPFGRITGEAEVAGVRGDAQHARPWGR